MQFSFDVIAADFVKDESTLQHTPVVVYGEGTGLASHTGQIAADFWRGNWISHVVSKEMHQGVQEGWIADSVSLHDVFHEDGVINTRKEETDGVIFLRKKGDDRETAVLQVLLKG